MPEVRKILSYRHNHKPFVAAYIRVSTAKNGQAESLENQAAYYEQKIKSNPEWEFTMIYIFLLPHDISLQVRADSWIGLLSCGNQI